MTAQYSFTITGLEIDALKGESNGTNANREITADRGLQRRVAHRVLTSKFGDGYEQRVRDGINTKEDTFSISFKNRPAEEINLIAAYLDSKAGLNFSMIVDSLNGNETIQVTSEQYEITYQYEEIYSLATTLRRVYEPQ